MKLKPLGDRVIVKAVEEEEVTASGIVLPDTAKERPSAGWSSPSATAAGWTASGSRSTSSEGDTVVYSKYGGTEVKLEGEDVLILSEHDILARIAETPKAPAKRAASRKPAAKKPAAKKK